MAGRALLVDVHTHMYLPRYASLLRSRTAVPFIRSRQDGDRLVILDNEPSGGRPVGPQYWDRDQKLAFMDKHGIDISIVSSPLHSLLSIDDDLLTPDVNLCLVRLPLAQVSTANPWLDFLSPNEATQYARDLNTDLEEYCSSSPSLPSSPSTKRLYGMGLLPIVPGASVDHVLEELSRIEKLEHIRGLIMGTQGLGNGLDDPELEPIWERIASSSLVIFLHPHYGVPSSLYGPTNSSNGHVLPLALGFPFETTISITRLILSGTFDRHPDLKILLAHSGGALPALSSRLASCVEHDPMVKGRLKRDARWYLGKLFYDAVSYGPEEMDFLSATIGRAKRYGGSEGLDAEGTETPSSRMMFGTDHPFFPPVEAEGAVGGAGGEGESKWMSVVENLRAIDATRWTAEEKNGVRGGNAMRLFGIGQ